MDEHPHYADNLPPSSSLRLVAAPLVIGYPGSIYKGFSTIAAGEAYLNRGRAILAASREMAESNHLDDVQSQLGGLNLASAPSTPTKKYATPTKKYASPTKQYVTPSKTKGRGTSISSTSTFTGASTLTSINVPPPSVASMNVPAPSVNPSVFDTSTRSTLSEGWSDEDYHHVRDNVDPNTAPILSRQGEAALHRFGLAEEQKELVRLAFTVYDRKEGVEELMMDKAFVNAIVAAFWDGEMEAHRAENLY